MIYSAARLKFLHLCRPSVDRLKRHRRNLPPDTAENARKADEEIAILTHFPSWS